MDNIKNPKAKIKFYLADLLHQREVVRVAEQIIQYLNENCNGKLHAIINMLDVCEAGI